MTTINHNGPGMRRIEVAGGNYMADAMAPAEAKNQMAVQWDTWGHLAPKSGRQYKCKFSYVFTAWGYAMPIDSDFGSLDMSPWLFDDLNEFIEAQEKKAVEASGDHLHQPIGVFIFEGTYTKNRNGTCGFHGTVTEVAAFGAKAR